MLILLHRGQDPPSQGIQEPRVRRPILNSLPTKPHHRNHQLLDSHPIHMMQDKQKIPAAEVIPLAPLCNASSLQEGVGTAVWQGLNGPEPLFSYCIQGCRAARRFGGGLLGCGGKGFFVPVRPLFGLGRGF